MKLTVTRNNLYMALGVIGKAVKGGGTFPIYESCLLSISPDQMLILGGDGQVFISTPVKCTSEDSLDICLPYSRLFGLIKELPEQPLNISIIKQVVEITAASGKYTIPFEPGTDYPKLNTDDLTEFKIDSEPFVNGMDKTVFACLKDNNRPYLGGVYMELVNGYMCMTACNVIVLSTIHTPCDQVREKGFIIPERFISVIQGFDLEGEMVINVSDRNLSVSLPDGVVIKSVLLEGQFPDYRAIMPKNNTNTLSIGRAQLIGALKRVTLFSMDKESVIKMTLAQNEITINVSNALEENADEVIECNYEGDDLVVGFNGSMFLQALDKTLGETVDIALNDARTAVLLTGDDTNNVMLIMPFSLD